MLPLILESEVKYGRNNEEEGERFDFDSGDEVPEADRPAPGTPSAGDAGTDAASGSSGESPGGPPDPRPTHPLTSKRIGDLLGRGVVSAMSESTSCRFG